MNGLVEYVTSAAGAVKVAGSAIVGIAALVFVIIHVIKAVAATREKKMSAAVPHVAKALVVVLLAAIGIGGFIKLGSTLSPSDDLMPQDGNSVLEQAG